MINQFLKQYEQYKSYIDDRLNILIEEIDESEVVKAMKYSLNIGGKRIRPIFVLAFCELCEGSVDEALDIACAIEMIHTYSLIHDDLPCMDDDDLRRKKPSCHVKFGQATALLAGDALLTLAFDIISNSKIKDSDKIKIIKILSKAVGYRGMILGQDLDINLDDKLDLKTLNKIHNLKTGQLIKASTITGCVISNSSEIQIEAAQVYGQKVGLAFQIKDDILDIIGNEEIVGKPIFSDKNNKKVTYVNLIGIENCEKKVNELSIEAINILNSSFSDSDKDFIIDLTNFLLNRNY